MGRTDIVDVFLSAGIYGLTHHACPALAAEDHAGEQSHGITVRPSAGIQRKNLLYGIKITLADNCFMVMFQRNRWMVDHASFVIAVYNGSGKGGTAYTVDYARKTNRAVIQIDPNTLSVLPYTIVL